MTIFCNLYSSPKLNVLIIQGHCPKIMLNINTKKHNDSVAHYIIYIINILDLWQVEYHSESKRENLLLPLQGYSIWLAARVLLYAWKSKNKSFNKLINHQMISVRSLVKMFDGRGDVRRNSVTSANVWWFRIKSGQLTLELLLCLHRVPQMM